MSSAGATIARVTVGGASPYEVAIGPGVLAGVARAAGEASALAVVADEAVAPLHARRLGAAGEAPLLLAAGEATKSFARLEALLEALAERRLDRRACLVALGGGATCDVVGLAASLYLRGVAVVHCPTTLLAQVDASVGGKTAVNLRAGKNLAGTFHAPRAVLADTETLATLPARELASGLGEVVKSALVGDGELLALLEREAPRLLARDPALLALVVERCVRVKAAVVAADEREQGERRVLNLGHTFAHALEHAAGYGVLPHGIAVGTGLALALAAAARAGVLEDADLPGRVGRLLERLGLFPGLDALRRAFGVPLPRERVVAAFAADKKGARGSPLFVLPRRTGALATDVPLAPELLDALLA